MRTNNNFEKIEVKELNDVAMAIGRFDQATPADLFFGNSANPQALKGWKGVYNMDTNNMSAVVSDGYQIIQHNDVMHAVGETLGRLNLNVKGRINMI